MVNHMKEKAETEEPRFDTNFLIADNIWTKARIPNNTGKVGLWLGANVMVEYGFEEAIALLEKNYANANKRLEDSEEELNFLKDQVTTTEVNMARVYNQTVKNNKKTKES
eukprot:scpid106837/ scgid12843/ Prefoldin subunit 3; Von Hippel-Lindau-binding protein 1